MCCTEMQCLYVNVVYLFWTCYKVLEEFTSYCYRDREIESLRKQIKLLKGGVSREEEKANDLETKAK